MQSNERLKHLMLFSTLIVSVGVLLFSVNGSLTANADLFSQNTPAALNAGIESIQTLSDPPAPKNISLVAEAPVIPETIEAKSAISTLLEDGVPIIRYEKNVDTRLPIASLTKLMTALVVLKNYNLSQEITISADAMAQIGEQGVLKQGEVLTAENLLYILLIESSNRAAYALSEIAGPKTFVALMNQQAKDLAMTDTHFEDSSGLNGLSYSTARDLATLTQFLVEQYPLFMHIIGLKTYSLYLADGSLHHTLETTNKLLGGYGIIGGKTGWTNEARGCFMAIRQDEKGNDSIDIVLGAEDRFLEMEKLIHLTQ